jgi:flagellar biosynthesis/type III secretory pathway M-ring protein FliF/YscJ
VAARSEGTGAARKPLPRTPEDLEKLKRIVQSALGSQVNGDLRKDEITLEEMPFTDPVTEVSANLGKEEKKEFWWKQAQNFVYAGLALFVLFIFWRLLKKTSAEQLPTPAQAESMILASGGQAYGNGRGTAGGQRPNLQGVINVETLNQLVRENPANVTQAIQNWLTRNSAT